MTGAREKGRREAKPPPLARARVILVEPAEPGNVGAVARAMLNLGASELRLVVADAGRVRRLCGSTARRRACHGAPILAARRVFPDLRTAVADVSLVLAFSARSGRFRQPRRPLAEAAAAAARRMDQESCALVFGPEESGLTAADVTVAHELVTIPVAGRDPVLNLSHAVTLALWELARARGALAELPVRRRADPPATAAERTALRDDFDALLVELGFPRRELGDLHGRILRRFVDLFDRAGARHADASMLRGLAVAVRRRASPGGGPAVRRRP